MCYTFAQTRLQKLSQLNLLLVNCCYLLRHAVSMNFTIMCFVSVLTRQLCTVLVVVSVSAELDEIVVSTSAELYDTEFDDETEDRIVSQWREISADEKHSLRDRVDEILRPLRDETSLVVMRRGNTMNVLALYFICMTLSALMSLRDQWRSRQLRHIVQSLFTFLSGVTATTYTVRVNRLNWPLISYEQCLDFFSSVQGKRSDHKVLYIHYIHRLSEIFII